VKRFDEKPNQSRLASTDLYENRLRENDLQEHDLQEAVRRRAYQIYEERGMLDGFELEDWLRAESEIVDRARIQKAA
jgi:hypothetical protein